MLDFHGLYPILDVEAAARRGHDLVACAQGLAGLGLEIQQLRAKTLPAGELLRLADRLRAVVPCLIVNDRPDVALLAGAAGVHLGQDDLPAVAARRLGPPRWIIGVSTHNPGQIADARALKPDYIALGPIFSTASKPKPDPVVGVQAVTEARKQYRGPLVAIGGIQLGNCAEAWQAGADAVAVIAALWDAPAPVEMARRFLLAFARLSCHSPGESCPPRAPR